MWLANRHFLFGLLGAAIPILIHLLTRDRVQRVAFSTLRFFARTSRNILRRKRLQEAILVALRASACALLALAFARPFLAAAGGEGVLTAGTACAVVVDLSGSMGRPGLPQALREEAMSAVNERGAGDAAALVTFADAALVAQPLTQDLGDVRARIALLTPGHGGTDIVEALRRADGLLRQARARTKRLVLVSDLQRTGWRGAPDDWRLAPGVELLIRALQPSEDRGNLAIVESSFPQSAVASPAPQPVAVRVRNFGTVASRCGVALHVHGEKQAEQEIHLQPDATAAVRFRYAFERPGDNPGTVSLAADDGDVVDNVLYFNTRVIPRIPVLVLDGRPAVARSGNAAYFLAKALAPGGPSSFHVETVAASEATAAHVRRALVVLLANVGEVPAPAAAALGELLERGGGLFFLPGDAAEAETFNRLLGGMAPCKLRRRLTPTARGQTAEAAWAKVDYDHPVFEIFHRPHHGDLSRPQFRQFWEVTDSQLARVLARFDDGRPAVLEREIGAGVSMMLVSAPDMRWNNLPLRTIFLPFVHQAVRYLAIRTEKPVQFVVGGRLPVPEGCRLRGPDGKVREGPETVADRPGFYSVVGAEGAEELVLAVNRAPAEADPTVVPPDEITAAVTRAAGTTPESAGQERAEAGRGPDGGFWWYLVLGVVALSLGELVLGNHTHRH